MSFQAAIKICLRKYFVFSGRASRAEYWWFALFVFLGGMILAVFESLINGLTGTREGPTILSGTFNVVTLVPGIAVGWRRMHDSGRSGLYLLYPLIVMAGIASYMTFAMDMTPTMVGDHGLDVSGFNAFVLSIAGLVLIVSPFLVVWWLTRPSQPGPNKYGPNPHEVLT